jgi:hypothetical protein
MSQKAFRKIAAGLNEALEIARGRTKPARLPQKEIAFHLQLVEILRHCIRPNVFWRHYPAGELRDKRTAAKLKAMGTLPGSADLEFFYVSDIGTGLQVLFLELKRPGGKCSEPQVAFALAMKLLGAEYFVVTSIDEAITILGTRGLIKSNVEVCGRRW